MTEQRAQLNFDDLDLAGKIRKLDAELYVVKKQLARHRQMMSVLLSALATVSESFPDKPTDAGAELRALAFEFDDRTLSDDADFFRTPK